MDEDALRVGFARLVDTFDTLNNGYMLKRFDNDMSPEKFWDRLGQYTSNRGWEPQLKDWIWQSMRSPSGEPKPREHRTTRLWLYLKSEVERLYKMPLMQSL